MAMRRRYQRRAAALVSVAAILVVVAAFAAVFLSVHSAQLSTRENAIHRLRAQAAAMGAAHLTLWKLSRDADWQAAMARPVHEGDTSFAADPLFTTKGDLAGATFIVEVWPGDDTVRLKCRAFSGGVFFDRWAQMPIQIAATSDLLIGGDFENPAVIGTTPAWLGQASLGTWLAGYGFSNVDDPESGREVPQPWNISSDAGNHFAEELRWSNTMAQYVEGRGVTGRLTLEFDYLRSSGQLRVAVRGVEKLPDSGALFPGTASYRDWENAGDLLYDSGNLPSTKSWETLTATVDAGNGYRYYVVQVIGRGGSGAPTRTERAIDNVSLK